MGWCHIKKRGRVTWLFRELGAAIARAMQVPFIFFYKTRHFSRRDRVEQYLFSRLAFPFSSNLQREQKRHNDRGINVCRRYTKFRITALFLRAVKKDGMKEGWSFHFANPRLSFYAMRDLLSCVESRLFLLLFFSFFFFAEFELRPIGASRRVARGSDCSLKINKRPDG